MVSTGTIAESYFIEPLLANSLGDFVKSQIYFLSVNLLIKLINSLNIFAT